MGQVGGQCQRNGTAAGTHVGDAERAGGGGLRIELLRPLEDSLYQEFGFGAGDQRCRRQPEIQAIELLVARDVLQRRTALPRLDGPLKRHLLRRLQRIVRVGVEPGAVPSEHVKQQNRGVLPVDRLGCLRESLAQGDGSAVGGV